MQAIEKRGGRTISRGCGPVNDTVVHRGYCAKGRLRGPSPMIASSTTAPAARRLLAGAGMDVGYESWSMTRATQFLRWTHPRRLTHHGAMRMVERRGSSMAGLSLLLLVACDPTAFFVDDQENVMESPEPAEVQQGPEPASAVAAAAPEEDYQQCIAACGGNMTATDRETCELQCRAKAGTLHPPTIVQRFSACAEGCDDVKPATDRETCRLQCAATLELPPEADAACVQTCLQKLTECRRPCGSESTRATDRESCSLQCESVASSCVDRCAAER